MIIICVQRRHTTRHEFISKTHSHPDNCHWNIYISVFSIFFVNGNYHHLNTQIQTKQKDYYYYFSNSIIKKNFPKCLA